jgi:hypothetical protein
MSQNDQEEVRHLLRLRLAGRDAALPLASLGLSVEATDAQIKGALATYLDRPVQTLHGHVVVRQPTEILVRPKALYG